MALRLDSKNCEVVIASATVAWETTDNKRDSEFIETMRDQGEQLADAAKQRGDERNNFMERWCQSVAKAICRGWNFTDMLEDFEKQFR